MRERNSLWPPGGSVHHCQEVTKHLAGGQWPHQIQMYVEKSSARDRNPGDSGFHVRLDLTLLKLEAGPCPEANILGKAGPHKLRGQKPTHPDGRGHEEKGTVDDVEQ